MPANDNAMNGLSSGAPSCAGGAAQSRLIEDPTSRENITSRALSARIENHHFRFTNGWLVSSNVNLSKKTLAYTTHAIGTTYLLYKSTSLVLTLSTHIGTVKAST